ncbi:MAG: DUF1512 domain-containing protein [Desulfurococcus sp.]|jgi:hypothetical protein|uniref:DUF1512 domain-containing protein n=1 Tax=Desulfurococcus sp. TaxID=51678 RepID=UPI00315E097F
MDGDTASLIIQVIWLIMFFLIITGLNQKIQMKIWVTDIRMKLDLIKGILEEDKQKTKAMLRNLGIQSPEPLIDRVIEFFTIEPVEIEPVDIIKRMDHLIRTTDTTVRRLIEAEIPHVGKYERSLVETTLSIVGALHVIYKVVRHYLLTGEKENNWILIMQLQLQMPQILKYVNTYHEAFDAFATGKPIGDGIGPLVAYRLIESGKKISSRILDDTSITEVWYKDRRIYVVKAEGPGSNVGHPGAVINRLVDELKGSVDLMVTVDAALKLEGEKSGSIAEGVGAAIGDPGPEKIAIERAASKYGIPLRALVIKMDLREAITVMRKEIFEAADSTLKYLERIIEEHTKPYSTIIVAGIGNTMGIPG